MSGAKKHIGRVLSGDVLECKQLMYRVTSALRGLDMKFASRGNLGLQKERSIGYEDSGGPKLDYVLKNLPIANDDSIIDLGCGKGGAMITMAQHGFLHVDGIEISPALVSIARENLIRCDVGRARIFCCDAAEFLAYDPYTFIYMFNPFPERVVRAAVGNLVGSSKRNGKPLTLIYNNPVCEEAVLAAGFHKIREFNHDFLPVHVYRLSPGAVN